MTRKTTIPEVIPAPLPERAAVAVTSSTRARSDAELIASWLAGLGSDRSRANFATTAERFLSILSAGGLTLRTATIEDVRDAAATLAEGKAASSAVQYAQRIKSLLSYAHRLGYVPFNAGVAVRTRSGNVDRAKRIASETEIALLIQECALAAVAGGSSMRGCFFDDDRDTAGGK